jgi:hypothetical protein
MRRPPDAPSRQAGGRRPPLAAVRPHGFGRWRDHDTALEFFLEHHRQEERFSDLIAALAGYDALAQATPQLATNVLVWLTAPRGKPSSTERPSTPLPPRHRHLTARRQPR